MRKLLGALGLAVVLLRCWAGACAAPPLAMKGMNDTPQTVCAATEVPTQTQTQAETPTSALAEVAVPEFIVPPYTPEELELLACVIYQEAGGNACTDECRNYVGSVVLNRLEDKRFPDTLEGVLTEKWQYGTYYETGVVWPDRAAYDTESEAVARAYSAARELLEGNRGLDVGYVWQSEHMQSSDSFKCCGIWFGR
ncbi:MAG: cell wall hydrolase [Oscillospiraceae bacterium]